MRWFGDIIWFWTGEVTRGHLATHSAIHPQAKYPAGLTPTLSGVQFEQSECLPAREGKGEAVENIGLCTWGSRDHLTILDKVAHEASDPEGPLRTNHVTKKWQK